MLSWMAFWAGDVVSKVLGWIDAEWWSAFWYPQYSFLMQASLRLQGDRLGRWPWGAADKQLDEVRTSQ